MVLNWENPSEGIYIANADMLVLGVALENNGWLITIDMTDIDARLIECLGFEGTLAEAQAKALELANEMCAPLLKLARAKEREGIVQHILQIAADRAKEGREDEAETARDIARIINDHERSQG